MSDELAQRNWRSVRAGGYQSPEDGLAESGVSPSGEELEELCEKGRVRHAKRMSVTYSHEEVMIKILAFRVLLELVLYSSSLD